MLAHGLRAQGVGGSRQPETGRVPRLVPRGRGGEPGRLQARVAAQALRTAGAQDLRRLRLVGGVVARGSRKRRPALARIPRASRGLGADGRRGHGQDAHGERALPARVRQPDRGQVLHGVLARHASAPRPRGGPARPRDVADSTGAPARNRRAGVFAARRRRRASRLPSLRRRLREGKA